MKYLLQFIIGSCVFVFAWFFYFVNKRINDNQLDTDYYNYTMKMPLAFGTLNVLGKVIQDYTKINDLFRYLLISIIGALGIISIITYYKSYKYSILGWLLHYFGVFVFYITAFACIMNTLEKLVLNKKWAKYEIIFVSLFSSLFLVTFSYFVIFDNQIE